MRPAGGPGGGAAATGLCGSCRHAKTIVSDRGSRFLLCRRSRTDPAYARYPRLPVRSCPGFERDAEAEDRGPGARSGEAP